MCAVFFTVSMVALAIAIYVSVIKLTDLICDKIWGKPKK